MLCLNFLLLLNGMSLTHQYPRTFYSSAYMLRSTNPLPIGDVHLVETVHTPTLPLALSAGVIPENYNDALSTAVLQTEFERGVQAEIQKRLRSWMKYMRQHMNSIYKGIVHYVRPTATGHQNSYDNNINNHVLYWIPIGANVSFNFGLGLEASGSFDFSKN